MAYPNVDAQRPVAAAIALIAAGVVEIVAMAFHPGTHGPGPQAWMSELAKVSVLNTHVHMIMIAAVIAVWLSLAWCFRRRPPSGWSWMAERLYALGALAMVGAALINGFAVAHYARRVVGIEGIDAAAAASTAMLASSFNQTLAGFGTLLLSLGVIAWSTGLWRNSSRLAKAAAAYGIVAGTVCCLAYAAGLLRLDAHGMSAVVIAHALWYALVGAYALRSP